MAELKLDPAGVFPSDVHRRVLGHLSFPDDGYGWSAGALRFRLADEGLDEATLGRVLDELRAAEHAECVGEGEGVWRMTAKGLALLTGPIANEPAESGLALIESLKFSAGAATMIGVKSK